MKDKDFINRVTGASLIILALLLIAIFANAGCSSNPAPWVQEAEQAETIPCPTCCEKVNTIVYGREAGCK